MKATEIPIPLENREIVLIDDVLFTGRTVRAAIDALLGEDQKNNAISFVDRVIENYNSARFLWEKSSNKKK